VTAKRLVENGKWIFWLAGIVAVFAASAVGINRAAIGKNCDDITNLKVQTGKVETHIEYIARGVKRLEQERGTYVAPPAKK